MKKILALFMVCFTIAQTGVIAEGFQYEGDFRDPFNNSLFEVVAESAYANHFMHDFKNVEMERSEDGKCKVVEVTMKYDGTISKKDLCDFTDSETAYDIYYAADTYAFKEGFNDGLVSCGEEDGCYLGGLKDITNTVRYECPTWDYFGYEYNLGLLCEGENTGWSGAPIEERQYKTTFTALMTGGKKYEFNYDITPFNDDGYALMITNEKSYVLKLKKGFIPTVTYNGKKIRFDQIPVIENGRTLVPLRAIFETIGAEVKWDDATKTVKATKGDTTVKLTVNSKTATKNGEKIALDVPAKIVNGRTLVPVRFVSDCFGIKVDWDGTMQRVKLSK